MGLYKLASVCTDFGGANGSTRFSSISTVSVVILEMSPITYTPMHLLLYR